MEICPIDFLSENNHHLTSFLHFLKILPVGQKAMLSEVPQWYMITILFLNAKGIISTVTMTP